MGAYPSGAKGHATVDPRAPRAWGICDRDGMRWNRSDLTWQYEWSGNSLRNKRILVCPRCLDIPNPQLRSYSPPPDPVPIRDPRPDLSYMGYAPNVVYTIACTPSFPELDGFGNPVLDGFGNWVIAIAGTYGVLLPAAVGAWQPDLDGFGNPILDGHGNPVLSETPGPGARSLVNFDLPASFGLWINPLGGLCSPAAPNCRFYAANSYFEEFGTICNNAITYFTTIAGLQVVVQSQ